MATTVGQRSKRERITGPSKSGVSARASAAASSPFEQPRWRSATASSAIEASPQRP